VTHLLTRLLIQIFFWAWTFFEVAVVAASLETSPTQSNVLSAFVACCPTLGAPKIRITPMFLVGWFFALFGSIIRLACYRTLGDLFTFELSIRKNHRLITSGPYAVVRHPSYTGLIMVIFGYSLCHLSSGSWLRECSGLSLDGTVGKVLVSMWAISGVFSVSVTVARTYKEDTMLKNEFSDWDQWARQVRFKLIPFVF
jgi:protein-S-isoprenylcysteine O-methyltransferase Ste14